MPVRCIVFKWTELSHLPMLHEVSPEEVHQKMSRFSKRWSQIGNQTDLQGQRAPSCYTLCSHQSLQLQLPRKNCPSVSSLPPITWADNSWCMSYSALSRSVHVETKGVEAWKFHEVLIYTQMFMINQTETIVQTAAFGNYTELLWYKQKEAFCIQSWKNLERRHRTVKGLTAFAR